MVEQLAADYPDRFAPLTMHVNGDGYDIPWGQQRLDDFYGVAGAVPTFMVDALWNCQSGDYRYHVEQQLAVPADTTLELSGEPVGGATWDIVARVCLEGGSSRDVRLFTAAALDDHPDLQDYVTNVLMQKVVETDVTIAGGGCETVTTRITFDPVSMANTANITIVSWAQEPAPSAPTTVHQAAVMRWPFPAGSLLQTIEIDPADVTMAVGDEIVFTASGRDQSGADFPLTDPVWSLGTAGSGAGSFDPGAGSATTTFTATAPGTRQVFCTEGGVSGAALVTIVDAPVLTAIEIDPASATVDVGGELTFTATGTDQYGESFPLDDPQWSVSGDGAGTFDPELGVVTTFTATYPGAVTISCTRDGVSGTAAVEIAGDDPRLETITVSPARAQLRVGDELDLTATGLDQYGWEVDLGDADWRFEGSGDGRFEPAAGAATTFTATGEGEGDIVCSADGVEGAATIEIAPRGLPAPRKILRRVKPS